MLCAEYILDSLAEATKIKSIGAMIFPHIKMVNKRFLRPPSFAKA